MMSFLLIAGLGSYLVVGLLCVGAFAIAGVAAYFYLRAKNREALDPAKGLVAGDSPVALGEMRELTSRIEEIVTTQQDHGETQRAHLSRKIDQVRESVESQHHAVTGLRHELRHEIDKRDAEMHEIRHQIASVREGLALPPAEQAALPPGPSASDLGAPETYAAMSPVSFGSEPEAEDATFTEVPTDPSPAFDEMAFAPLDAGPEEASPAGLAFAFEEEDVAPLSEASAFSFEDVAFDPASDAPSFEDAPDPLDPAATPAFAFEEEAFEAPAEAPTFAFEEEPSFEEEPAPEAPVFSFEEDESATEEAFQVVSFLEPDDTPSQEPAPMPFAFEEDTPMPESARLAPEAEAPAPEMPAFSFEEDEPAPAAGETPTFEDALVADAPAFETSPAATPEPTPAFEPEPIAEPAPFAFEEDEPAEMPMTLSFEEDEVPMAGHVAMEAAQASVATARFNDSLAPLPDAPSPRFAPPLAAPSGDAGPGEAPPSAWISRPDRQPPETPVETIGGIAVERVGDVPPVEPADLAPEAEAPAPPPVVDDEFPSPVVASELVVESFDFGIDVDAELAAAGQAPLDEEPEFDPPIRHAPVPPLRMEVSAPEPAAAAPSPAPAPPAQEEPEEEVEAYVPPQGAEDLSVISSVDADTMRALHMAGVLTLDEIARWGRSDARRIATEVGVAEETIMHQWIFEAQSALFERYSRR